MGPLALMARAAGFEVCGSDLAKGAIYDELVDAGIEVFIGEQDGEFLREHILRKKLASVAKQIEHKLKLKLACAVEIPVYQLGGHEEK